MYISFSLLYTNRHILYPDLCLAFLTYQCSITSVIICGTLMVVKSGVWNQIALVQILTFAVTTFVTLNRLLYPLALPFSGYKMGAVAVQISTCLPELLEDEMHSSSSMRQAASALTMDIAHGSHHYSDRYCHHHSSTIPPYRISASFLSCQCSIVYNVRESHRQSSSILFHQLLSLS